MSSDGGAGVGAAEVDVVGAVVEGATTAAGVDVVDSVDAGSSSALPQPDATSRTATTEVVTHPRAGDAHAVFELRGLIFATLT